MILTEPFVIRAALAALATGLVASLLGCFVVWRRMAYFGDAVSHAAVLGVALSLALSISLTAGVLAVAVVMALALHWLDRPGAEANTALGVLAHTGLAAGVLAAGALPGRVDLEAYLFGEPLTVLWGEVAALWAGGAVIAGVILWRWQRLLAATVNRELAVAAGVDPRREDLILTLLIAGVVAVAIKVVGALLITALLLIPAAAARGLSRTPEGMAAIAAAIAALAALGGVGVAVWADLPVGPAIVCTAAAVFLVTTLAARR